MSTEEQPPREPSGLPPLVPSLAHVVLDPFVAILPFVLVVVMLSLSVGLTPLFLLGLPLLLMTFAVSGGFAAVQRGRIAALFGVEIPTPRRPSASRRGLFAKVRADLASGAQWRQVGYHVAALPLTTVTWTLSFGFAGSGLALAATPAWSARMDRSKIGLLSSGWLVLGWTVLGVLALALSPYVVRGAAAADIWLAGALLGQDERAELVARVDTLTETRAGVVAAADAERQRIERDLHDGAQQRLVSLAMSLGRAQHKLDTDPDGARALLAEAHDEAKLALVEIRDLARGIHPSILTDRGLGSALSPVAARMQVPVRLDIELDPRPPADVEAVAYYTVVEALTNIAKHADASSASVLVRRVAGTLLLEIRDDGQGGADPAQGSGLRGLTGRLAGVDGRLSVSSPSGGPTVVSVQIPDPTTPTGDAR